jgi:hypothetical protein
MPGHSESLGAPVPLCRARSFGAGANSDATSLKCDGNESGDHPVLDILCNDRGYFSCDERASHWHCGFTRIRFCLHLLGLNIGPSPACWLSFPHVQRSRDVAIQSASQPDPPAAELDHGSVP